MARSALLLSLVLGLGFLPALAHAQATTHPRVATLRTLESDTPALFIDADSAWVHELPERALALCSGSRCAPIERSEACAVPRCPGDGVLVHASERLVDVGDFPSDYQGFTAECSALSSVSELASLMRFQRAHPNPPGPPLDLRAGDDDMRFEVGLDGGFVSSFDRPLEGGLVSARFDVVGSLDADEVDAAIIGNQISLGIAVHTWIAPTVTGGVEVPLVLFGFHPAVANAVRRAPVRVPSLVSLLLPEFGAAFRPDLRIDLYAMWGVEGSLILARELGVRLRASATFIVNTEDTDLTEGIGLLSAGFFLPVVVDD